MNDRSSTSSLSPYALVTFLNSTTLSPSRRENGIRMSVASRLRSLSCLTSSSYALIRALLLACRARGVMLIHSSSRDSVRRRLLSAFSSFSSRLRFWSSHEE